jgi:DNA polymerase IV
MKESWRKIIHIDMDAFFAAVEIRDFPQYRGKPLIVGGSPEGRGVVSTCSYEARKFGVHSAMPSYLAQKLCPQAIFVGGRFQAYEQASDQIMEILASYSPVIEPLSLDEAFLDVTSQAEDFAAAVEIAESIRKEIKKKVHLTASAGVSYNKFLAKLASDMNKPNGLTLITPDKAEEVVSGLDIRKLYGIGKATEKKMRELGINSGADLMKKEEYFLIRYFGKAGSFYHKMARGIDNRPVTSEDSRKSLGKERTFRRDLYNIVEMKSVLRSLADDVGRSMQSENIKGRTVTVKIKYNDFTLHTRSRSLTGFTCRAETICETALQILEVNYQKGRGVRLLGVSVSNLDSDEVCKETKQLFFDFFGETI